MKALYFLCVFFFLTATLSAQYEKGSWYLNANSNARLNVPLGDSPPAGVDYANADYQVNAFQAGYFFTDRILVGSQVSIFGFSNDVPSVTLRPFARYYFPGGERRKVSYFGEVGFGTLDAGGGSGFETDFYVGGGAEVTLFPGVVGSALFRYNANASGLNFTSLNFGLNLLLGQLENTDKTAALSAGTFTTKGSFGGLSYGRMSSGGSTDWRASVSFNPNIGYFIANGLMLEGDIRFSYFSLTGGISNENKFTNLSTNLSLNARYYFQQFGTLLPFVTGGVGYNSDRLTTERDGAESTALTQSGFFYRGGAGVSYFLSPNVALDGSILYQSNRSDILTFNQLDNYKTLSAEVGIRFFIER